MAMSIVNGHIIGGVDEPALAPQFKTSISYEAGDMAIYGGSMFVCIKACSGAWDSDNWQITNMASEVKDLNSNLSVNDFTITTAWESNTDTGDYSNYPYKQTISTSKYTSDSACDCLVFGADPTAFMTETEREEKAYLCAEVLFTATGITVLASDKTTGALTLRVKGV